MQEPPVTRRDDIVRVTLTMLLVMTLLILVAMIAFGVVFTIVLAPA